MKNCNHEKNVFPYFRWKDLTIPLKELPSSYTFLPYYFSRISWILINFAKIKKKVRIFSDDFNFYHKIFTPLIISKNLKFVFRQCIISPENKAPLPRGPQFKNLRCFIEIVMSIKFIFSFTILLHCYNERLVSG